jgi:alpha-glucoside transport system substrate-binding protein
MTWRRFTSAPNRPALPIRRASVGCALAIAAFGSGGAALSAERPAPTIEVLAPYTESDRATVLRVAAAFTAHTGINVQYTLCCNGSLPQLQTRIAAGDPPDVAVVFRPGDLPMLAHQGDLVPLRALGLTASHMREDFGAGLLRVATVDGSLYGVPLKASSKSLIWYKPNSFRRQRLNVPRTWHELLAVSRSYRAGGLIPWAVGCGPGAADSWTLTDWFENIYLRTAGPKKYERLFAGRVPFTHASVVHALKLMLQIVNNQYVLGGVRGALDTSWGDAIANVFGREAKAQLYMEGGFIGQIVLGQLNTSLRPGVTIDSMPWPTIDARFRNEIIGGADFAVALTNTPAVRQFLLYLSSAAAGKTWASAGEVTGSWSVSPNRLVPRTSYANPLVGNEAHQVANANSFQFDGSDELPGSLGVTWASALQSIIKTPAGLRQTLSRFQRQARKAFRGDDGYDNTRSGHARPVRTGFAGVGFFSVVDQWRLASRPAASCPRRAYARLAPSGCMNGIARTSR